MEEEKNSSKRFTGDGNWSISLMMRLILLCQWRGSCRKPAVLIGWLVDTLASGYKSNIALCSLAVVAAAAAGAASDNEMTCYRP
jgi:hypothetical protein